jgi:predicted RNA-binding Zn ribbon-like protein
LSVGSHALAPASQRCVALASAQGNSSFRPIVPATADLLTSTNLDRVRLRDDEKCRWVFLDTSRNRSRRWCEMNLCGNRAKGRRFHARKKQSD